MRVIAFALALGVCATGVYAEEGEDDKAPAKPDAAKLQIMDPAVHNLVRLEPLVLGADNDSTKMAPMEYRLKVGQGYRWKIKASDLTEYAFVAPAFIRDIWIRKVEVGEVEIKAVTLDELEFENGGEAELFFVARDLRIRLAWPDGSRCAWQDYRRVRRQLVSFYI
jgi:hypothetical protein